MDRRFHPTLSLGVLASFLAFGVFLVTARDPPQAPAEIPGLESEFWVALEEEQRSSLELRARDPSYAAWSRPRLRTRRPYAYLWVRLRNGGATDREFRFLNQSSNYHTEMLVPERYGAATLHRQGDLVPISALPLRHHRAVFPGMVPAGESLEFVVEFHSPRGIVIDPLLLEPTEFFSRTAQERLWIGLVFGGLLALLFSAAAMGVFLRQPELLAAAGFLAALGLFCFRQSRVMLLVPGLTHPAWLLPLSIALNLLGAVAFSAVVFGRHCGGGLRRALRGAAFLAVLLAAASLIAAPLLLSDLLNILALCVLVLILLAARRGARAGDARAMPIVLSFLPWVSTMIADILQSYRGDRLAGLGEYRQALGLLASLLLLTLVLLASYRATRERRLAGLAEKLTQVRAESDQRFAALATLRTTAYRQVGHLLRQPLEGIVAAARILGREYADPGIAAAGALIIEEAELLRRRIDERLPGRSEPGDGGAAGPIGALTGAEVPLAPPRDSGNQVQGRICLYDRDPERAARKAIILQAEGYEVFVAPDSRSIEELFARDGADALVLDPDSVGEEAFSLCGRLREERNLLELPILMITNQDADYQRRKGYAAGVNDFLTRPFGAAELAARVQSLSRLKQVARHNHDLARSEKEKNAFLFFLTHNVNTPLTILLNRIRELETSDRVAPECREDILACAQEINDIVQNVLIAFRLSDGRQTIRLGECDLGMALDSVFSDLRRKAETKRQRFGIERAPGELLVPGDYTTIRGILYNLADNAIKFSPPGGRILVRVSAEPRVRLEVVDSGPGIPQDERHRLFGRFETLSTRPTGGESSTGLGLYVAAELARMNGLRLECADAAAGACFSLEFPGYGASEASRA